MQAYVQSIWPLIRHLNRIIRHGAGRTTFHGMKTTDMGTRVWLVAALLAAMLYAAAFYAFPDLPPAKQQPRRREPVVNFQQPRPPREGQASDSSALSPLLLALPSRVFQYFPSENIPPGKPPLDAPPTATIRPQPPRETTPSLEDWITRLGRERNRPPSTRADPQKGTASLPGATGWRLYDGLEGLHADLTRLELKTNQAARCNHLVVEALIRRERASSLVESTGLDKVLPCKLTCSAPMRISTNRQRDRNVQSAFNQRMAQPKCTKKQPPHRTLRPCHPWAVHRGLVPLYCHGMTSPALPTLAHPCAACG